jgi:hypothetical protein
MPLNSLISSVSLRLATVPTSLWLVAWLFGPQPGGLTGPSQAGGLRYFRHTYHATT